MRRDPNFADVTSDQRDQGLQMAIRVDRAAAARYGVTMSVIDNTLFAPVDAIFWLRDAAHGQSS